MPIAYLDGIYSPLAEIKISAMDRGFLFGDGVYEVIPVYNNSPFRLTQHLARLAKSLQAIALDIHAVDLPGIINKLILRNPSSQEQGLYLQITRGASAYRDHKIPRDIKPTVFGYCMTIPTSDRANLAKGVKAITVPDIRWGRCDIKSINLLPNIMMKQVAEKQGAFEAIFLRDNKALEGTSMNLFVVKDNVIRTPPLGQQVLGGITRELVLQLARENNFGTEERDIESKELAVADELWLTSSTKEIVPVTCVDNYLINNAQVGPLWSKMQNYYQCYKTQLIQG